MTTSVLIMCQQTGNCTREEKSLHWCCWLGSEKMSEAVFPSTIFICRFGKVDGNCKIWSYFLNFAKTLGEFGLFQKTNSSNKSWCSENLPHMTDQLCPTSASFRIALLSLCLQTAGNIVNNSWYDRTITASNTFLKTLSILLSFFSPDILKIHSKVTRQSFGHIERVKYIFQTHLMRPSVENTSVFLSYS